MTQFNRSSLDRDHVMKNLRHLTGSDMVMLMFYAITKSYIRTSDSLGWFSDKQIEGRLRLLLPKLKINKVDFLKYKKMQTELISILHPFVNLHLGLPMPLPNRDELLKDKYYLAIDEVLTYFQLPLARKLYNKGINCKVSFEDIGSLAKSKPDDYIAYCHITRLNPDHQLNENLISMRVGDIKRRFMARVNNPIFKDERFKKVKQNKDITLDMFSDYKILLYMGIEPEYTDMYRFFREVKGESHDDICNIFERNKDITTVDELGEVMRGTDMISSASPYISPLIGCQTLNNTVLNKLIFTTVDLNYVALRVPNNQVAATLWVDVYSVVDKEFSKYTRA
ncbi:hypothetical protein VCHA53O466_50072 [Vibrio chagasii]|nr:hypothetical protein VCHA53O466_50072 [Vibrio chagasii]